MKKKIHQHIKKPLILLSILVIFVTVYSLVLPAITLDEETANNAPDIVLDSNTEETTVQNDEPTEKQTEEIPDETVETPTVEETETVTAESDEPVETINNEDTQEPQETELVQVEAESEYPAVKFSQVVNDSIIYVEAPEGAFMKGTSMEAEEVEDTSELVESINNDLKNSVVKKIKAIDIRFIYNEEEVEPLVPIKVSITSAFVENNDEDAFLMHIDDEGKTNEVKQNELKEEELETLSEEIKDVVEEHEEITEVSSENTITFESDSFSVYAIVYVQTIQIEADGGTYNITVSYTEDAQIPEGSVLNVREIEAGTVEYELYLTKSATQLNTSNENISFARFFDIDILKDGEKIEPDVPVNVDIKFNKALDIGKGQEFNIVHFIDEEIIETINDKNINEDNTQFSYVQCSFSVTATIVSNTTDNIPNLTSDNKYMVLVKDDVNNKTYIVLNNGKLEEMDPITLQKPFMMFETPMFWKYMNEYGNIHLFHNSDAIGYDGNDLACGYYQRYIDPSVSSGITTETKNEVLDRDSGLVKIEISINDHGYNYVKDRMDALYQTNLILEHIKDDNNVYLYTIIKHQKKDSSDPFGDYYLSVKTNADGDFILSNTTDPNSAAHIVFAETPNVPEPSSAAQWERNHAVNHIDIGIAGKADLTVPLATRRYYYQDSSSSTGYSYFDETSHRELLLSKSQVRITTDDIKRAVIEAYIWDNSGNKVYIDDAFEVTGFSANSHTGISYDQVRIEGVFKVANLPYVSDENFNDATKYNQVKQDRLNNKINYSITTTIPVTFDVIDSLNGHGQLYELKEVDGEERYVPLRITSNIVFSASFDFWDWYGTITVNKTDGSESTKVSYETGKGFNPSLDSIDNIDYTKFVVANGDVKKGSNECPAVQIFTSYGWIGGYSTFMDWQNGGIPNAGNSGMDFVLGGDAGIQDSNNYALNIQKNIVDEKGDLISPNRKIENEFKIFFRENEYSWDDTHEHITGNTANSVKDLNVGKYETEISTAGYGTTPLHLQEISIGSSDPSISSGTALVYDYDVKPGMYYIEEVKDSIPSYISDHNGKTWLYKGTKIKTEYVWRNNGKSGWHVSELYNSSSSRLISNPEVLGEYATPDNQISYLNPDTGQYEPIKNGFLTFRVYNIYEPLKINIVKTDSENHKIVGAKFNLAKKNSNLWVNYGSYGEIDMTNLSEYQISIEHNGFYRITETKSPSGYYILESPIYFKVENGVITLVDEDLNPISDVSNLPVVLSGKTIQIKNEGGVELPMTGGSGSEYICMIGCLIMLVSGLIIIKRRYTA